MTVGADLEVAGARAGLVLSKLLVPSERPGDVRRNALLERLLRPDGPSLVSAVAPGGYGKTTALAQWAAESPSAFAWLTVDEDDNDVALLAREIEVALDGAEAIRPDMRDGRARTGAVGTAVNRLRVLVASAQAPFVLVLDDVHELTSLAARDFLASLLRSLPEQSHLVLSGRTELPEVAAAARVSQDILELAPADFALDDEEARALLAAVGPAQHDDHADAYVTLAEGWAAGLYLLALTRPEPGAEGTSAGRYVSDYLWTQHLGALPEEQLEFLVSTSVLERLCGPLCDAVLERNGSTRLLDEIERGSPFIVPLDREREWYRYHDLFRAALVTELERRGQTSSAVRQRASDWCLANEMAEQAMAYALAAGDTDRMAHVLVASAFRLYRTGRLATAAGWLDLFDDGDLLGRYPSVAALGAIAQALLERPFQAERWLDTAARGAHSAPPAPDGSSVEAWVACAAACLCRHGVDPMLEDAERALAGLTPFSPLRGPALLMRGVALRLLDDPRAEIALEEAADAAEATGATFAGSAARSKLALLALERGDVAKAERHCARFVGVLEEPVFVDYHALALPLVTHARTQLAAGNAGNGARILAAAQRIRPFLTHAIPHVNIRALIEMARAYLELGDPVSARAVLFDAGELLRHRPALGVLVQEVERLRQMAAGTPTADTAWELSLTTAELRLLPLLTTHLSFREIGERLFVSRNTVKTQAISIYRKLGATSRGEAVGRAAELGLIDAEPSVGRPITPNG